LPGAKIPIIGKALMFYEPNPRMMKYPFPEPQS